MISLVPWRYLYGMVIIMVIGFLAGCVPKLFQYPIDSDELRSEKEKPELKKYIDLIETLERKSKPDIAVKQFPKSEQKPPRVYRKDLHDPIDDEWKDGWAYLATANLNLHASTAEGDDGILVPQGKLANSSQNFSSKTCSPEGNTKLSFIHLSDVQLRDETVYMFDKKLTELLDFFISGFSHIHDLVFFDHSYYLNLIAMVNLIVRDQDPAPQFMIHTGDGIHMGVVSESYNFIQITNELAIPWYDVLGNHDYTVYGNLESETVGVVDPSMLFQTVTSRHNFINMHGKGFQIDKKVYFSPLNAPHGPTKEKTGSIYNGFDRDGKGYLEEGDVNERINKACMNCPGYYYFEAVAPEGKEPGILILVLNTSKEDFDFARGEISEKQIKWIRDVLYRYSRNGNWIVLAFGHHPLAEKYLSSGAKDVVTLFENPNYNVVAYFCGHTHENKIIYHKNSNDARAFGFWEIIANSIMEYPKKGSLVNVTCSEQGNWEVTLQSFWPYFLENELSPEAPIMLKNAKKCYEASKKDDYGKKKAYYENFAETDHDIRLRFSILSRE